MEIDTLQKEIGDLRHEGTDTDRSLSLLMANLGTMAEIQVRLAAVDESKLPEETLAEAHRTMLGGIVVACVEYADEHDVDMEGAVEERVESMRETKEKRDEVREAMEEKDAAKLADALDADQNEVPIDTDDGDKRGFY